MVGIANREVLIRNAGSPRDRRARGLALRGLEAALEAADPRAAVESHVALRGDRLEVGGLSLDLGGVRRILVVGGGKAGGPMAEALEGVLGDRVTEGLVNVPHGALGRYRTRRIRLQGASHPIPDEAGVEGTRRILRLVSEAGEGDLVLCLISGGGSSLMPLPREGVSLEDKRAVTEALVMRSPATIREINAVRKHLSGFKGGWLAREAHPATVVSLLLSDVVGDPVDTIASGPTAPDPSTFRDATGTLRRYGLWEGAPESVRKLLLEGERGLVPETPKPGDEAFRRVHNVVIGSNRLACMGACNGLRGAGLHTLFLSSQVEGEARHVGTVLAALAQEVSSTGNPVPRPAGIVVGGETTVTVAGRGTGGRNQEVALGAALKMDGMDGAVVASMSTDGVDGPTDAAGAIADGKTLTRSQEAGLSAEGLLADNDSYAFFSGLGDLILTGPTGTNVNDVSIIVVT